MAKKFVRGVTGIEYIESYDKTLTNVNDILSDGQNTYVHTKKGKTEIYYNLTDNVKQVESADELLSITKEDDTISIANSGLATKEELGTKQNTLQSNSSIAFAGNTMRQLYALLQSYNVSGGILKTHVKSVSENSNVNKADEEFNFIVKINKGVSSVNFTLNTHDTTKFTNIMSAYGSNNTVNISDCVFTLSGSTLTVSTTNNTNQNYVITFSDII